MMSLHVGKSKSYIFYYWKLGLLTLHERYAYGCNELVFNPLRKWYRGPFTRLFWRFLFSNIKITSKITILAYIGTCESLPP